MYLLKKTIYIFLLVLLQTVVFPRLAFFGIIPDLFLISAVVFSVLEEERPAIITSTVLGFVQDIFSIKIYFNTVFKGLASAIINFIKADFKGDDYTFSTMMLAIYTASWVVLQHIALYFVFGKQIDVFNFIFILSAQTAYNLLLMPLAFAAITKMKDGQ